MFPCQSNYILSILVGQTPDPTPHKTDSKGKMLEYVIVIQLVSFMDKNNETFSLNAILATKIKYACFNYML